MRPKPLQPGEEQKARPRVLWPLLGLFFLGIYSIAALAPTGQLWGVHALGYLPWWVRAAGLLWCAAFLLPGVQSALVQWNDRTLAPVLARSNQSLQKVIVLVLASFAAFYLFAIRTEIYGDTPTILKWYADNKSLPLAWFAHIFDLQLLTHRESLTLLLNRAVAHLFALPIGQAFRLVSAISGAAFLFLWIQFVRRDCGDSKWGGLLLLLGCLIGSNQIFFGHIETYPFASLLSLSFLLVGWTALKKPQYFWATPILLFLAIAAHPASLYFLPAFAVLGLSLLARRYPRIQTWLTWRRLGLAVVLPSLLIGLGLYLFYFRSYAEPYAGAGRVFEHSFLPVVPAPPPLDGYTFQSINHLRDLVNVLLLVGMPVILGLAGVLVLHFKEIDWKRPEVMFATFGLGYPLLFFTVVNPGLSMPRDWDMFALLGPPLLLMTAAVLINSGDRIPRRPVFGTGVAFGVFSLAACALNASPGPLSTRLEVVGEYVFSTYYTGSSYILNQAHSMEPDTARAIARRKSTLKRLAPYVIKDDVEYTNLASTLGRIYRDRGQLNEGIYWFEQAERVSPDDTNVASYLIDAYLRDKRTDAARSRIARFLKMKPRDFGLLMLAAVAASQEGDLKSAVQYLEQAKAVDPTAAQVDTWLVEARAALAARKSSPATSDRSTRSGPARPRPPRSANADNLQ